MIAATADCITSLFAQDHRLIELALGRFHHEVATRRARVSLDAFEEMLLRHISREDSVLFPAFENKIGAEAIACAGSMRDQHDDLKLRIAELRRALRRGGWKRREVEEMLIEALTDHNHAEEFFLYPWMDSAFTHYERIGLLQALE